MQKKITVPMLVRNILFGWLLAVTVEYMLLPAGLQELTGLQGLAQMSFGRVIVITCVLGAVLSGISCFYETEKIARWGIVSAFSLLAALACKASYTESFLVVCLLIVGILVYYAIRGWDKTAEPAPQIKKTHWGYGVGTAVLAVGFFVYVSCWTVARVETFSTPSYDFGIFSHLCWLFGY